MAAEYLVGEVPGRLGSMTDPTLHTAHTCRPAPAALDEIRTGDVL